MAQADRLIALISIFVEQLQKMEYVLSDLKTKRWINDANGQQLDGLGQILNVARLGRTDVEYLAALKSEIFNNQSN